MKIENFGAGVFTISDYLSVDECKKYISDSEKVGYEIATINAISGPEINKEIRNNDRVIFDDQELASTLFKKAAPHLPKQIDGW